MRNLPAAAADEEADLRALSDRAGKSRQALAATADELAEAIAAPLRRVTVIALPALALLTAATVYLIRRRLR
jgi:hypothetical protein